MLTIGVPSPRASSAEGATSYTASHHKLWLSFNDWSHETINFITFWLFPDDYKINNEIEILTDRI